MNEETLKKLLEYIDVRIDQKISSHADSWSGGLNEVVRAKEIRAELFELIAK